jgi:hypothetical protein
MILLLLFFGVAPTMAQSLSARISNARVEEGNFKWDVEIKRTDDWGIGDGNDVLGNCDFYFYINKDGFTLDAPTTSNIHVSLSGNANYGFRTGRSGVNSQCWVALDYSVYGGGSDWYPPLDSWELLFTASLQITDPNEQSGLTWHETSTGFSRGNDQGLTNTLIGDGDMALPVELVFFTAENHSGSVLLKWCTESETENQGFIIEKRVTTDGNWGRIVSYLNNDALEGHGTSTETHNYRFVDNIVQSGVTYAYRLGDVDYNSEITWHKKVGVKVESEEEKMPVEFGLQKAYPNPFNPSVTLSYGLTEDAQITLLIYDIRGQLVETLQNAFQTVGSYHITWQPMNIGTGMYIVRLTSNSDISMQKVVFVK